MRPARSPVLVSAHRFGVGRDRGTENTLPALDATLELGVDYVEFDVQRASDGRLVVAHDEPVGDVERLDYAVVLDAVAGRARAHLDLKFASEDGAEEVAAVRLAVQRLGVDHLVVTTGHDGAVRAVRDWAAAAGVDLLVGLSLGRSVRGLSWWHRLEVRRSELLPHLRVRESGANVVVAHWLLARLGVGAFARRRGLPLLVWTVDTDRELRHWLRPGRCWMVTTNHPSRALAIRGGCG